jgi:hypothetical protein
MDEPRDSATFRTAVAGLGLSLAVALIGICIILAFGGDEIVKHGGHSAVRRDQHGGVLDKHRRANSHNHSHTHSYERVRSLTPEVPPELWLFVWGLAGALVGLLLPARRVDGVLACVLLVAIALVVLGYGVGGSTPLQCVLVASGAALVALLIPTPARYDEVAIRQPKKKASEP